MHVYMSVMHAQLPWRPGSQAQLGGQDAVMGPGHGQLETVPVQLTGLEMENSTMLWSVFISEVGQNIKVHDQHLAFSWCFQWSMF
jgi:hypothetical protein